MGAEEAESTPKFVSKQIRASQRYLLAYEAHQRRRQSATKAAENGHLASAIFNGALAGVLYLRRFPVSTGLAKSFSSERQSLPSAKGYAEVRERCGVMAGAAVETLVARGYIGFEPDEPPSVSLAGSKISVDPNALQTSVAPL